MPRPESFLAKAVFIISLRSRYLYTLSKEQILYTLSKEQILYTLSKEQISLYSL